MQGLAGGMKVPFRNRFPLFTPLNFVTIFLSSVFIVFVASYNYTNYQLLARGMEAISRTHIFVIAFATIALRILSKKTNNLYTVFVLTLNLVIYFSISMYAVLLGGVFIEINSFAAEFYAPFLAIVYLVIVALSAYITPKILYSQEKYIRRYFAYEYVILTILFLAPIPVLLSISTNEYEIKESFYKNYTRDITLTAIKQNNEYVCNKLKIVDFPEIGYIGNSTSDPKYSYPAVQLGSCFASARAVKRHNDELCYITDTKGYNEADARILNTHNIAKTEALLIAQYCQNIYSEYFSGNTVRLRRIKFPQDDNGKLAVFGELPGPIHPETCTTLMERFDKQIVANGNFVSRSSSDNFVAATFIKEECVEEDCKVRDLYFLGRSKVGVIRWTTPLKNDFFRCRTDDAQEPYGTCFFNLNDLNENDIMVDERLDKFHPISYQKASCYDLNWKQRENIYRNMSKGLPFPAGDELSESWKEKREYPIYSSPKLECDQTCRNYWGSAFKTCMTICNIKIIKSDVNHKDPFLLPPEEQCPDEMSYIPPGSFAMGCTSTDFMCDDDALNNKVISITHGFCMDKYEVTNRMYSRQHPSEIACPDCPATFDTWADAAKYCYSIGKDMPTEAEWEYAARGKEKDSKYGKVDYFFNVTTHEPLLVLDKIAWHAGNSGYKPHPVGLKEPNSFGLYDTIGNLQEWVYDCFDEYCHSNMDIKSPVCDAGYCDYRVVRGGSYQSGFGLSVFGRGKEEIGRDVTGVRCKKGVTVLVQ